MVAKTSVASSQTDVGATWPSATMPIATMPQPATNSRPGSMTTPGADESSVRPLPSGPRREALPVQERRRGDAGGDRRHRHTCLDEQPRRENAGSHKVFPRAHHLSHHIATNSSVV